MRYKLRLPNITGKTEKEKIAQMENYLYQLVGDLQFVINSMEEPSSNTAGQPAQTARSRAVSTKKQTEETE
mgnify:FL=1|jgi:hypothetical protein